MVQWLQTYLTSKPIELHKVTTHDNFADALTKHLPAPTLCKRMNRLGLLDVTSVMNFSLDSVTSSHTVTSDATSFVTRFVTRETRMTLWLFDCLFLSFFLSFLSFSLSLCFFFFSLSLPLSLSLLFHSCALALH